MGTHDVCCATLEANSDAQRQRFVAVLACRNVAANRRVLVHLCKIIEACKCKQRFSVRCLYAVRSA